VGQREFDNILGAERLPALAYAEVMKALAQLDIKLIPDDPDQADDDEEDVEGGWDADGFDHFLKRNWHEVLSPEEEHDLAVKMQSGRLARAALDEHPDLPSDVRWDLTRRVEAGKQAEDRLTRLNLRLVAKIANRFRSRTTPGMSVEDLFDEGVMGFCHALQLFDPDRGYKLSTYATWWIRQHLDRAIKDKAFVIRVPVHMHESLAQLREATAQLTAGGETPTITALARVLDVPVERVRVLQSINPHAISLDVPLANARGSIGDFLGDPTADPAEMVADNEESRRILALLPEVLTEREFDVICLRFGLQDNIVHTLEEVGQQFGVTRERIRQIESKAIGKLKNPAVKRLLQVQTSVTAPVPTRKTRYKQAKGRRAG
jgi:RNA polymerase primary sigma factor